MSVESFKGLGRIVNDGGKYHLKGNSHQRRIQKRSLFRYETKYLFCVGNPDAYFKVETQ